MERQLHQRHLGKIRLKEWIQRVSSIFKPLLSRGNKDNVTKESQGFILQRYTLVCTIMAKDSYSDLNLIKHL